MQNSLPACCLMLLFVLPAYAAIHDNSIPDFAQTIIAAQASCPSCRENAFHVSEDELTALRIDFVKNQILKKLRMKERPAVNIPLSGVPKPVAEGATIESYRENKHHKERDEYYGKTTQKIIFPKEDNSRCAVLPNERYPSACFSIDLPKDVDAVDVSVAALWLYKESDDLDSHNQTFLVSTVGHWDSKRSFMKTNSIAIIETSVGKGWVKADIAWSVKNWFQYHELSQTIRVVCMTCAMEAEDTPVSLETHFRPFIVIDTHSQTKKRRKKRNINCGPGVHECCREKLYISFKDIGWDDWILHPNGYHAYFCRGSCSTAASVTLSASPHNSMLRKVMNMHGDDRGLNDNHILTHSGDSKRFEIIPCCTATQYSSLQLLYMENNNTATQKTLPNMVVESCGCM